MDKKIGFGFSNLMRIGDSQYLKILMNFMIAIFFYRTFLCDKKTTVIKYKADKPKGGISLKLLFLLTFLIFTLIFILPVCASGENTTVASEKLVVLMPTPEKYANEYIEKFKIWHFNRTGKTIEVEYVQKGGVECIEHIENQKVHPNEDVVASIGFDAIDRLRTGGYLEPYKSPDAKFIPDTILKTLVGKNPEGYYTGFSLSAIGIMVNTEVLENESLPMPAGYKDLASNKDYNGRIVMGSPILSRIAHGNMDVMLSHFGWVNGWNMTLQVTSHVDEFLPTTEAAVKATAEGDYAVTLTKYTYWYEYDEKGYPVEWIWPEEGTNIYILYTSILKGAKNKENAQSWIDWMLSEEGQRAWIDCRYETPLRSDIKLPGRMPTVKELGRIAKVEPNYDEYIVAARYDTVTDICLRLIGQHADLKKNYNNQEKLDAYLNNLVIKPKTNAEEVMVTAGSAIKNASAMKLTEKGEYHIDRAKMLLTESQSLYELCDYNEAHRLAKESANAAEIAMAYPILPPQPVIWPYYVIIGIITVLLVALYLRRKQLERYNLQLEKMVEERTSKLAHANLRLKELDQLKSLFIASMSHELRTPLNSIIGFTGIILRGMSGDITKEQKKQLTMVKSSADHLLGLINDIIDLSRIEAGHVDVEIEEFNLSELAEEVNDSFAVAAERKNLNMTINVPENLMIESDDRRVKQVFVNLPGNAVKFTKNGKIELTMSIIHDPENGRGSDMVKVSIKDTGIGIRKEKMDQLFKAFSRVHANDLTLQESTGLGLYLSKRIVNFLGGEITVESEFGRGSEFIFKLPLKYSRTKQDQMN